MGKDQVILGVCEIAAAGHDSSLCALDMDGNILVVLESERFTKIKKFSPLIQRRMLAEAFRHFDPRRVSHLAVSNIPIPAHIGRRVRLRPGALDRPALDWLQAGTCAPASAVFRLTEHFPNLEQVSFVRHHLAHLHSAYQPSPFDRALILSLDGCGEYEESLNIGVGDGRDCRRLWAAHPHVGLFYDALPEYCGLPGAEGTGKVMGLAPFGRPVYAEALLKELIELDKDALSFRFRHGIDSLDAVHRRMESVFGPATRFDGFDPLRDYPQHSKDMAASAQKVIEDYILLVVERFTRETGLRSLCLAGGVAMNSCANGMILRSGLVDDLFVQPASADNGISIGAAYAVLKSVNPGWRDRPERFVLRHTYYGTAFSDAEVDRALAFFDLPAEPLPDKAAWTAERLAAGEVVGWFQGRMEYAQRALGNRSILSDSRSRAHKDRINVKVKDREFWRPFAPATLDSHIGEYFEFDRHEPFMGVVYGVRPEWVERLQAVTHVDGTARVQSVRREDNPAYYDVIRHFGERTGVYVILNTSLNNKGQPISRTPAEALALFLLSQMDALVLNDRAVTRKPASLPGPAELKLWALLWELTDGGGFHYRWLDAPAAEAVAGHEDILRRMGGEPLHDGASGVRAIVLLGLGRLDGPFGREVLAPHALLEARSRHPGAELLLVDGVGESARCPLDDFGQAFPLTDILAVPAPLERFAPCRRLNTQDAGRFYQQVRELPPEALVAVWPVGATGRGIMEGGTPEGFPVQGGDIAYAVDSGKAGQRLADGRVILSPADFLREAAGVGRPLTVLVATETYHEAILEQLSVLGESVEAVLVAADFTLFRKA